MYVLGWAWIRQVRPQPPCADRVQREPSPPQAWRAVDSIASRLGRMLLEEGLFPACMRVLSHYTQGYRVVCIYPTREQPSMCMCACVRKIVSVCVCTHASVPHARANKCVRACVRTRASYRYSLVIASLATGSSSCSACTAGSYNGATGAYVSTMLMSTYCLL